MRRGGGNLKGAEYERVLCKKFSLWLSYGKQEDLFWRSAMSGGRATVGFKSGKLHQVAGDMCAIHKLGHQLTDKFVVEHKFNNKDLALLSFLVSGTGRLAKFWKEISRVAKRHNRLPMLVAKQNYSPAIVITQQGELGLEPQIVLNFKHLHCDIWKLDYLLEHDPKEVLL